MKIESTKQVGAETELVISGTTPSMMNVLRRAISFEVPVMAIKDIFYTENNSALYDEVMAHRLGLLVLKTPETTYKQYNLPAVCKCKGKGCALCRVKLTLKAEGPKTVYASDFKSKDASVTLAHPETPIVKLLEGQNVDLTAEAVLGVGTAHMKWSSGLAYYQQDAKAKDKFTFKIEPWGHLDVKTTVTKFVELLNEKIKAAKIK